MKKMKKMLALALAFVLAVTVLPMVGSEQAKAASIPGYYRWYMDYGGNSRFVTEGTPVVSGLTGFVVPSGKRRLYAKDYTNAIDEGGKKYISVTSHGATNKYERSCGLDNSSNYVTFTAPCDGTIEMCYKPGGSNNRKSTYLTVNDEQVGETITLDTNKGTNYSYWAADETCKYEMSVKEGKSYKIAAASDIALSQIIFEPSPVSASGASYRNATDEYTNGIRFGSTIDKTKINYSKVTESGTLIARKTTMESKGVTELTMASLDEVCLKVERTTYLDDTDEVLNYAAAIVNIPADKLDEQFVARSYVVIDGVTYYGAQMIDTWNSVKAKADKKVEQNI